MLILNRIYTINQIIKEFGGSAQPSMPFINSKVPYCKFDPKINPKFPAEAWIEIGPLRKKGALFLIQSNKRVPVFKKIETNKWQYIGDAKITDGTTKAVLHRINQNPPRNKVQMVLQFDYT